MDVRTYLEQQQIHPQLIHAVEEFRNQYPVEEKVKYRVTEPMMPFYGTEILEMGIAALLQKENLLLSWIVNSITTSCCTALMGHYSQRARYSGPYYRRMPRAYVGGDDPYLSEGSRPFRTW